MSKKGKVLVAMSGGIDSSVAAMLLHEQGYEVIGITMKTWDYATAGGARKTTGCCSLDDINDARSLAVEMGFHHIILDIREEFGDAIIDNFVEEYMAGRTPNPCVLCNTHIKWEALLKRADQLGCEYIATGHYAQIRKDNNRYIISKGLDQNKDQSYVLWGLTQKSLARTLFPLGGFDKPTIRQMALDRGYKELAKKSESFEICFVPDNDYRGFLKRKIKGLEEQVNGGNFIDMEGNIIGQHKGYPFYTIGQRKGLEVAFGDPRYVVKIDAKNNEVTLGTKEDLNKKEVYVKSPNLVKYDVLPTKMETLNKIRYKDKGTNGNISMLPDGRVKIEFYADVKGVAPGQSAVFYEGNDLVGGGFIDV